MLNVTKSAATYMEQVLEQAPDESVLRFVPQSEGLSIQFGTPTPGDTTFTHGEKTVLALDAPVAEALADKTLDVQSTEEGPKLVLT